MARTVYITGVAGFVGSNLADRLLSRGISVRGIDDLSAGLAEQVPSGVDLTVADLSSPQTTIDLRGVDAVFHLAAFSSVTGCRDDPARACRVHVDATLNLTRAMTSADVTRLVMAETSAIYEGTTVYPTPESVDAPRTTYAVTKRCGGRAAHWCGDQYGLAVTTMRYFNVYGPRQDMRRAVPPVIPAFAKALLTNTAPILYGDGTKSRDFVHVDDVNDFHELVIEREETFGGAYNVGTGKPITVLEVLAEVERATGRRIQPRHEAAWDAEAPITQADTTKTAGLGWSPKVSFEEGIRGCVEHVRKSLEEA